MTTNKNYGFFKVAAAIPKLEVADCIFNREQIEKLIFQAEKKKIQIIVFPELSISSYTCGDLFLQQTLIETSEKEVINLLNKTKELSICYIIGVPIEWNSKLYNCAIVCQKGKIHGVIPKTHLPNYSEFYEKRWFSSYYIGHDPTVITYTNSRVPFGTQLLFCMESQSIQFAIEICEDLWSIIPPSSYHSIAGAQLIFNLSASNELIGKQNYIKSLISHQSARCHTAYVYVSSGFGESTTDLVYSGNAYIYENGNLLTSTKRFQIDEQLIDCEIDIDLLNFERRKNTGFIHSSFSSYSDQYKKVMLNSFLELVPSIGKIKRKINSLPFIPLSDQYYYSSCEEILFIQIAGLAKRIKYTKSKSLIIGISGGLDSTLALLICTKTIDKLNFSRKMIYGITMPGFGTSSRTYKNALKLMKALDISIKKIIINKVCKQHFKDICHDQTIYNSTYENIQARERTQILMNLANQLNGIVIGTGDLSELALGWTTYNGDHMSMYGINTGIPKTLVFHLIKWIIDSKLNSSVGKILKDIINTPISPELIPIDKNGEMIHFTEHLLGPYELHDFFLYYTLRYGFTPRKIYFLAQQAFYSVYQNSTILKWMKLFYKRIFQNQFKRNCMPDGPKIGSINLSPRGDWRMPSDAQVNIWIKEIDTL